MLNCIRIRNYRILKELDIDGLSRVNLIAGRNNSGKTSLLEAIFLLSGAGNPELALNVNVVRGFEMGGLPAGGEFLWRELFSGLDSDRSIEISAHHASLGRLSLEVGWGEPRALEIPSEGAGTASMTNQPSQRALTFRYSGPGERQAENRIRLKGENSRLRYSTCLPRSVQPSYCLGAGAHAMTP